MSPSSRHPRFHVESEKLYRVELWEGGYDDEPSKPTTTYDAVLRYTVGEKWIELTLPNEGLAAMRMDFITRYQVTRHE